MLPLRRTWFRPSQSQASAMSLVSLSTGSEEMSSMRGGSPSGVPVGTLWGSAGGRGEQRCEHGECVQPTMVKHWAGQCAQ